MALAVVELVFYAMALSLRSRRRLSMPRRSFGSIVKDELKDALGCSDQDSSSMGKSETYLCSG